MRSRLEFLDNGETVHVRTFSPWLESLGQTAYRTGDDYDFFITLSQVSLLADFTTDDIVDGADFLVWQRGNGLTGQVDNSQGDANSDGIVDEGDLAIWEHTLGRAIAPAGPAVAVPDPTTCGLAFTAALLLALGRRRTP